ncbi:MAG: hypothetical protein JWQ40_4015 [Segetibacter sp.]|nr:hypothetical protein [Segetibacter sp.]
MTDHNEEISIAPVVVFLQRAIRHLLQRWILILSVAIIGGTISFFYASSKRQTYTATLTFMLSSESRGSAFSSMASLLGLGGGSSGGSDLFAGDNILTLFTSRNMIQKALFRQPPGNKDILVNIFVKETGLNEDWVEEPRTKNAFPFPKDTAKLTGVQDSLIRDIHGLIVSQYLQVGRPNKGLSYYGLNTTSTNETFSYYLTTFLMDETSAFFIETKTRLAKQNLEMVQREADSLRRLLGHTITATAASVDRTYNLNPALQVQRAPIQRSQVNTAFLTAVYNEVAQNVIGAKLNLQKEMPLYQIIDSPTLPLKASFPNVVKYVFAGFFLFAFLTIVILLLRFLLKSFKVNNTLSSSNS